MTSSPYTKDVIKTWSELHRDSRELAWELLKKAPGDNKRWEGIIAVTRGGMIPAAIIARELNIRLIDTLCISCYDDHQQVGELKVIKNTMLETDGQGYLVIDDLVDTGATLREVRRLLSAAHIATLYVKPSGEKLVDTFVDKFSQDTWVRFPWDMELGYAQPLVNR
nr:xanthine phosphoribosyltransferase [Parendozoicomonas sp. Alg238-R29]